MCISIKAERDTAATLMATHDAVVHVPGGSRFTSAGRKVKPMEAGYAAEVTGHTAKHIRNCVDPNQPCHQLSLKAWELMLLAGMDTSPLETLCAHLDGVFFKHPDIEINEADPEESLASVFKELGDVGQIVLENGRKNSPGGKRWSKREGESFNREIADVIVALLRYQNVAHAVHDMRGSQ